jgi:hypothetical protein
VSVPRIGNASYGDRAWLGLAQALAGPPGAGREPRAAR